MQISETLGSLFNQQAANEIGNANVYEQLASWCGIRGLKRISALFTAQANDERSHSMKFVKYLDDANCQLDIQDIPRTIPIWESCDDIAMARLELEMRTTQEIQDMYLLAVKENDFAAQSFLDWFAKEQVDEVTESERFLSIVKESNGNYLLLDLMAGD